MPSPQASPPPPKSPWGAQLLRTLAERGLMGRPVFIYVGPKTPIWCLSPYADDLAELIDAWARGPGQSAVADLLDGAPELQADAPLPRAWRWALASRFCEQSEALEQEKRAMEAQLGITSVAAADGLEAEVVDLWRLFPTTFARLGVPPGPQPLGVVLRLPWPGCPVTLGEVDAAKVVACVETLLGHAALSVQHVAIHPGDEQAALSEQCAPLGAVLAQSQLTAAQQSWQLRGDDGPAPPWLYAQARRWLWQIMVASTPPSA